MNEVQLRQHCLIQGEEFKKCAICGGLTQYIDYCSEQHICSEECMFRQNKMMSRADMSDEELFKDYVREVAISNVTADSMERALNFKVPLVELEKEDKRFKLENPVMEVKIYGEKVDMYLSLKDGVRRRYVSSCKLVFEEVAEYIRRDNNTRGLRFIEPYNKNKEDINALFVKLFN